MPEIKMPENKINLDMSINNVLTKLHDASLTVHTLLTIIKDEIKNKAELIQLQQTKIAELEGRNKEKISSENLSS